MSLNREQALFTVVLALLALLLYFRLGDSYATVAAPAGKAFELVAGAAAPDVALTGAGEPRHEGGGRDVFQPPRDWNPLPPLVLDAPPLPELAAVGLIPAPGVEPGALSHFRRDAPVRRAAAEEDEEGAAAEEGAAEEDEADTRFAGIDFGTEEGAAEEAVADESTLARSYDWIKRRSQRRIYGVIVNPERFRLLDDAGLAVRFRSVNVKTGQELGTAEFARADLEGDGVFGQGFGFADQVHTRVALEKRRIGAGSGTARLQLEAARLCLTWIDDNESAALEGAGEFVKAALAQDARNADAWELLVEIRRRSYDTEGELAALDEARQAGVASARLDTQRAAVYRRLELDLLAEETLLEALKANPNEFVARLELGALLLDDGRAAEAAAEYERAERAAADAGQRLAARVAMVRSLIRAGRLAEAATQVDRALRMGIESPDALVLKGTLDLAGLDTRAARTSLHQALALDPTHADAVFNLGIALALAAPEEGRAAAAAARDRFKEAAELAPLTSFRSAVARAELEESLGNLEMAAFWLDEALLCAPGEPYGLYRAGRIARRSGDVDLAKERLRESLERDGRIVDVLNELGFVALLEDEPKEAEQYLRESLRRERGQRQVEVLLGSALLRQNRVAEARDAYSRGVGDPERPDPAALCGTAWCDYREGAVDDALLAFANARAVVADVEDPFHVYADRNQTLVADHRDKEQWIDRFDRKQIKNNWQVREPYGPEVHIRPDGGLRVEGMQRPTDPDLPTELLRDIHGATFVLMEARVRASAKCEGTVGLRFAYEKPKGRGEGVSAYGEIAVARFPDGTIRVLARNDYDELVLDWVEVEGERLEAGEEALFAIEREDYEKGWFRVRIGDRVVMRGIEVRGLAKLKKQVVGGLFAFAGARRNIEFDCAYARVVRYRHEP